jgi:hypothetical protein
MWRRIREVQLAQDQQDELPRKLMSYQAVFGKAGFPVQDSYLWQKKSRRLHNLILPAFVDRLLLKLVSSGPDGCIFLV